LVLGVAVAISAIAIYALPDNAAATRSSSGERPVRSRGPELTARPGLPDVGPEGDTAGEAVRHPPQARASPVSAGGDDAGTARHDGGTAAVVEPDDVSAGDREASDLAVRCDAKLLDEPVDTEWSQEKNEQFHAFFARASLAGTKLRTMDCRTTMCRIEIAHHDNEDRQRFIASFSDLAGPRGVVFAHIESSNDLDVVVYVTRDGESLP
jgi:hypothetical protein